MTFKELRESSDMNLSQFAKYFGINYRTVQRWEYSERKCPEYLLDLMAYKLKIENHKADFIRLHTYLSEKEDTDIKLKHNAGLEIDPSELLNILSE